MAVSVSCAAWVVWECRSTASTPTGGSLPSVPATAAADFFWIPKTLPAEESIARLLEIGQKVGGRPILIPTTDHGGHLGGGARRGPARPDTASRARMPRWSALLCDKGRMQELARRSGVPTAQAVVPRSKARCGAVSRNGDLPRDGEGDGRGPLAPARRRHQVRDPDAPRTARVVRQGRRPRGTQPDDSGIHPRR